MASPYKKVHTGDMKGWVREEIVQLLPHHFFKDPIRAMHELYGEVIRESRLRWAAIFALPNEKRIFLKRDSTKGWFETFKYLFLPSKARKEWFIAHQLRKRNLNIPRPLGWMENVRWGVVKESYYLSEAIKSGVSLAEVADILKDERISTELVKTVIRVHSSGLLHQDLHAGNFLWDGESFFLIDLHRARLLRSLSLNQRLWNLSYLFHSLRSIWDEKEHLRFLDQYFEGDSISSQKKKDYLMKIHSWMDHLQKRQWQSRTKRCLKESTEFSIIKEEGIHYYHRRDFTLDHLKKIMEEHLSFVRGERQPGLVKRSAEVLVSIIDDGESRVCMKQFCYPHFWNRLKDYFRRSKGLKAWIAGNGLRARGIPCLKPLALIEKRDWLGLKEIYFVIEADEAGLELDRYLLKRFEDFTKKRLFVKAFAQWLSRFHKMKVYHRDMKTCNILVSKSGEAWNFNLLDLEDVRLDKKVDKRRLFKNFLQLNTSTPKIINKADRFRFFREYLRFNPIIKNQKSFMKQLIDKSKERGLVYISPQGVVTEKL